MTKEPRNIPATKDGAKATLTASQVETWEAAGWVVEKPKPKAKSKVKSELNQPKDEKDGKDNSAL